MRTSAYMTLLIISLFTLFFLHPGLLILDTTPTGGDTASHVYTASYLIGHLLPKGRLTGWCMGNLGGFPMLQNYFPLPFLITALLSHIMPFNIAFKVTTVLPIIALPLASFRFFRHLGQHYLTAAAASILTLPFLFMEGQTIWGGNILSVLSGTFCYSFGLCFALLFLGLLYEHFNGKPRRIACSCLLALAGFSHGYALLYAGFGSLFFLTTPGRFRRNLVDLSLIHGCAIGLMAFWLIPLIVYLPYTTRFGFAWSFSGFRDFLDQVFPVMVYPFVFSSLLTPVILFLYRKKNPRNPAGLYLLNLCFTGLILYLAGCLVKLVDIRFLPFFQFFSIVSGSLIFSVISPDNKTSLILIFLLLASTCLWIEHKETRIRAWAAHNYKGFENTALWSDYTKITGFFKGSANDPRVVYENSPVTEYAGTIRAFESLPYFSGRSTLEGVYLQGSLLSPFIYCLQAEMSEHPSTPFPEYAVPVRNLDSTVPHLSLFNVNHVILVDEKTKKAASEHPAFTSVAQSGPFQVFEIKGNRNLYAEPVKTKPYMISSPDFRQIFYSWFTSGNLDVPMVYIKKPDETDMKRFKSADPGMLRTLTPEPIGVTLTNLDVRVTDDEITIDHAQPGEPLMVKMSYHPGWRVEGADKIYLAAPAFMMVYPTSPHVRLKYGCTFPDYLGFTLSILTLACIFGWFIFIRLYPRHMDQH